MKRESESANRGYWFFRGARDGVSAMSRVFVFERIGVRIGSIEGDKERLVEDLLSVESSGDAALLEQKGSPSNVGNTKGNAETTREIA